MSEEKSIIKTGDLLTVFNYHLEVINIKLTDELTYKMKPIVNDILELGVKDAANKCYLIVAKVLNYYLLNNFHKFKIVDTFKNFNLMCSPNCTCDGCVGELITEFRNQDVKEINDLIAARSKKPKIDTNLISDGYHTFGELYEHRNMLFVVLCNTLDETISRNLRIWKTTKNIENESQEGWFILGITNLNNNQNISYHLPRKYWGDLPNIEQIEKAEFDGHNSSDVLERLKSWFI